MRESLFNVGFYVCVCVSSASMPLAVHSNTVASCNAVAAVLHALSALVVVLLVVLRPQKSPDIAYPLITSVCAWIPPTTSNDEPPASPHIMLQGMRVEPWVQSVQVSLSTTALVAGFAVLSCVFQSYWVFNHDKYMQLLQHGGTNSVRYYEYSISASLMLVLIALQVGLWDWGVLVGICACTFACMIFGLLAEVSLCVPQEYLQRVQGDWLLRRPWWLAHACGWVVMAAPFWVILVNLHAVGPPTFVYGIVYVETGLFIGFGLTQLWFIRWYDGSPRRQAVNELAYIWQSFVSKTVLIFLVYLLVLSNQFT